MLSFYVYFVMIINLVCASTKRSSRVIHKKLALVRQCFAQQKRSFLTKIKR